MLIDDTDVLEQDIETPEQQTQDEPITTLPDHAAGEKAQDRQALIDEALGEGQAEAEVQQIVDELGDTSKHPELTLEDLKKIPGAEGMTDEQLKQEWAKAVAEARGQGQQADQTGDQTVKLPFPVYDKQGNKVNADKVTLGDLLNGNLQVGYQALGKEQRKTLTEALRNASMGHWNEQRYETTRQERDRVAQERETYRAQVEQFTNERKVWDAALTALSMGNIEPMKKLAEAYKQALTAMPQAAPGMVNVDQVRQQQELEAAGQKFWTETVIPTGYDIAQRYGAKPQEVIGAIEHLVKQEGSFLTREKIDQIIQFEVPQLLEANGYTANASGTQQQPDKISELERTVQALQERIAKQTNTNTQATRERQKKAPPAGGGATPGAGDSMPSFKSRSQMKAWMQGDADWQKA